jgi:hypothetical protein
MPRCGGAPADGVRWSRLGSNQRPPACEAGALPLSYETGAETRTRSKISTHRPTGRKCRPSPSRGARRRRGICVVPLRWTIVVLRTGRRSRPLRADVAQLVAHHLAKVRVAGSNPVIRSKVHMASIQRWSGRVVRQRPAKPCTRVRFPSPPPDLFPGAISSAGERFPDTEEVTGSIPVSRTTVRAAST